MLAAALVAAATGPVALTLLDVTHQIPVDIDSYVQATIGPLVAAGFAYMAASVVYGLGREVVAARELGSYQLVERLGEGGMGEVWRARHHMLARPAAIKLIRPVLVDGAPQPVTEHMVARFEQEAQALASLRSPHTVDLFDFGVADDGSFYYAMELLEGLDTEVLVRRFGPVPAERTIHVLRQVCHSLSEAEARGLVHRDIKPANIFLCRYGEDYDFVKVLDFGIVKSTHVSTRTPALTRETTVAGSPAFIAPEQAMGDRTVDGRADIYAIGCVGYWLLTGQFVFSADNAMSHLMHHINTPPAAPSTRTEMPIPPALEGLLLSCLAKSPNDRPQSAKQLLRALDQVVTAEPWTDGRARAWWAEHPMGHG
jgi:serine/threonine-protein kinase